MPNLSYYEKRHIQKLIEQEGSLKLIFDTFVRRSSRLLTKYSTSDNSDVWAGNKSIEKDIEKELEALNQRLKKSIDDFAIDAWNLSDLKNDDLVTNYVKGLPIGEVVVSGMMIRNQDALQAFLDRKVEGYTISGNVWKITQSAKENLEFYLASGISTGRSANEISQDIRQLLKDPDKLFRRIRNENGKLVPSAPMQDYHPGRGVYRSSFMNAKRLAATQTNMAYRTADSKRWSRFDFILGVEIRRSDNAKGPCPTCDELVGAYPKDYVYWGWHPWCICIATPILMSEEKFMEYLATGIMPKMDMIKDIPERARAFMDAQLEKDNVTKNSYLFVNNQKYFQDNIKINPDLSNKSHAELSKIFIQERNKNKRVEFMSPLTVESIKDSKILLINEGKTGCIIAPDGDLQNVFNNAGRGQGSEIIKSAIENGAQKLDCFDGYLTSYYSQFGFKEVERIKWDDQYAPPNWNYEKNGRPDVVFMKI